MADRRTSAEIAACHSGIQDRMVVIPINLLDQTDPLPEYAAARLAERQIEQENVRDDMRPEDVLAVLSLIRF